jgi:hypothetical protein
VIYSINIDQEQKHFVPQNIYITNGEEIKEGCEVWVYKEDAKSKVFKHFYTTNEWYKDVKKSF